ncbi:hypothetical protein [Actinomadura violacea]|uniref:Uncharacterized protein n=1 Tax=Actinomadura violacea TaxID=2819934 RepID=A0ABS3RYA9_9ACTN|nr:hypothetical protein [Actinomadura violacea]MBO2461631.1 hypothetical protein [Actinomadura violacea]
MRFPVGTQEYASAVRRTLSQDPDSIARWLTPVCPECEEKPVTAGPGITTADGKIEYDRWGHLVVDGNVVVGCEAFWVVSPAVVGVADSAGWCDWTE